jgi:GMC oxidoreductase
MTKAVISIVALTTSIGSKQRSFNYATLNTEIPKGEATGNLEVRPQCHVLRIEHDKAGRVTGVVYADKQSNYHRQRTRIVCVAGNSIETPGILLNSASSRYPEGLVNSSGQVGRNYMRHMSGAVWAPYSINPYGCTAGTRWPAASRTSKIIDQIGIRRWLLYADVAPRPVFPRCEAG